ncbi:pyridoxamine 5'-phosphate oxidase-like protein [Litoreibacter ponti]|uniref:Pyridoxamine 5'-phosphate oxidase-like protein n=1 Tax=Litoreibacter ponti TaxID=1510457 RepID=A0A2T6BJB3_9RHOB|nr:pyridoxamine 5'-phosphate oxidase family protein [Litoreibacter ponti]PTX56150.1 pyridoxamine 5'-phosphate oxidase-like protein [Litoreibacter ponti]
MSDPADLQVFLRLAWQRLGRGVADRRAAARNITFATVSPEGLPEVRTVVLRAASQEDATLEVHTDPHTAKIAALRATPYAELQVWDPSPRLQIRARARVEIVTGPKADARWQKVPDPARQSYGTQPTPGTAIDGPFDYEKPGLRDGFAVLICHLEHIDLVELQERHRRAVFVARDGWAGRWVSP